MFYPVFKSIWLPKRLTRTIITRGVGLPFLSLGNLQNLEIIEHPLVSTDTEPPTPEDLARLLVICSRDWRSSRRLIARPRIFALLTALALKKITRGGFVDIGEVVWKWFSDQNDFPTRYISEDEKKQIPDPSGHEFGSTPTLRLMMMLARVPGWRDVSGLKDIRDITLQMARALRIADNENNGAHYVSKDTENLIERLQHGNS